MKITIDEWLYYFLRDKKKFKMASEFLLKVIEKCDLLITKRGSEFMKKIWKLSKESQYFEPERKKCAKFFFDAIFKNSNKFEILENQETLSVPSELTLKVSKKDFYLIETALATEDRFILTTDRKLFEILSSCCEIKVELVDDFLKKYLQQQA